MEYYPKIMLTFDIFAKSIRVEGATDPGLTHTDIDEGRSKAYTYRNSTHSAKPDHLAAPTKIGRRNRPPTSWSSSYIFQFICIALNRPASSFIQPAQI